MVQSCKKAGNQVTCYVPGANRRFLLHQSSVVQAAAADSGCVIPRGVSASPVLFPAHPPVEQQQQQQQQRPRRRSRLGKARRGQPIPRSNP